MCVLYKVVSTVHMTESFDKNSWCILYITYITKSNFRWPLPSPDMCSSRPSHQGMSWKADGLVHHTLLSLRQSPSVWHSTAHCYCEWGWQEAACYLASREWADLLCHNQSSEGIYGDHHRSFQSSELGRNQQTKCSVRLPWSAGTEETQNWYGNRKLADFFFFYLSELPYTKCI